MGFLTVYCQPGAKRTEWQGLHDGLPKVRIHALAIEGAANRELIRFLAHELDLAPSAIRISRGEHSRIKQVQISTRTDQEITSRLSACQPTLVDVHKPK